MIRMEQPSYCFNSCDVGEPHYKMWHTTVGPENMTPTDLAAEILVTNTVALKMTGSSLQNIILNTHGFPGCLWIGGMLKTGMYEKDLAAFGILRPHNVGTIWIVSCDAAYTPKGQSFCQALATTAGTQVIAADEGQIVTPGQGVKLVLSWRWNIDDFEGRVYSFTPRGGMKVGIDPERDVWTVRS